MRASAALDEHLRVLPRQPARKAPGSRSVAVRAVGEHRVGGDNFIKALGGEPASISPRAFRVRDQAEALEAQREARLGHLDELLLAL